MALTEPVPANSCLVSKWLFTDASCLQKHNVTAWAGMLISGDESWIDGGLLPDGVTSSCEFEMLAVAKSLEIHFRAGRIRRGEGVLIFTDNFTVTHWIGRAKSSNKISGGFKDALERVKDFAAANKLFIAATWIAGHQGTDTTDWRGLINSRVDRQARFLARAERDRRKKAVPGQPTSEAEAGHQKPGVDVHAADTQAGAEALADIRAISAGGNNGR